jgi:hypothetical protein
MWMAMEMEVVEREIGARIEMEMQRRRKRRRILLHNLCSGSYIIL